MKSIVESINEGSDSDVKIASNDSIQAFVKSATPGHDKTTMYSAYIMSTSKKYLYKGEWQESFSDAEKIAKREFKKRL